MGSTIKTLHRIMTLTNSGDLKPEGSICDIGATQLFGEGTVEGIFSFLTFYADRTDKAVRPENVPDEKIQEIANDGFLGDLLILAGFEYKALDIFHAVNTIIFDLNIHAPGPNLFQSFDLVLNLGTTEHVMNQLRAFQTIHDLVSPGGLIYHDLPMSGYLDHALFRYDPLFFKSLFPANKYELLLEEISVGSEKPVSSDLSSKGFTLETLSDVGIEVIVRRTSESSFKIPMEISTALAVDPDFESVAEDRDVVIAEGTEIFYGGSIDLESISFKDLLKTTLRRLVRGVARRVGLGVI